MISQARRLTDAAGRRGLGVSCTAATATWRPARPAPTARTSSSTRRRPRSTLRQRAVDTALAAFCRAQKPDLVLVGATPWGKDLGPKARRAKLGCACVSDAMALKLEGGAWEIRRPVYAGKCFVDVVPKTAPAIVGIRPNAFVAQAGNGAAAAVAGVRRPAGAGEPKARRARGGRGGGQDALTEAEIVGLGGRGIKGPENYGLIEDLASGAGRGGGREPRHRRRGLGRLLPPGRPDGQDRRAEPVRRLRHQRRDPAPRGHELSKCIVAINKDASRPHLQGGRLRHRGATSLRGGARADASWARSCRSSTLPSAMTVGIAHHLGQDLAQRLHAVDQADGLAGHQRAHARRRRRRRPRAAAHPEVLDLVLGFLAVDLAQAQLLQQLQLQIPEVSIAWLFSARTATTGSLRCTAAWRSPRGRAP
jgi:hypothetical protein